MRKIEARSLFINLKPVFIAIFLLTIIGIGTSQANNSNEAAAATDKSKTVDNNKTIDQWETVKIRVTAYCPCPKCCGEYSDGITANGHKINPGDTFVAADKKYSFGTEMIIPGYNNSEPVKVLDRGGAIQGNRLDVFFATHQEALEWGVRNLDVKVLCQ